jgi:hypothetical protein
MRDPWDETRVAQQFRDQATSALPRSPLVAALSNTIARDPALFGLLAHAPPTQRRPVLLLASLHLLVIEQPDSPLARWFPTVWTGPGAVRTPDDPDLGSVIASFVAERAPALLDLLANRSTQTNEVGRCATLLPAIGLVAAECGSVAHVDVGASGGLNLLLDRYDYRYEPGGAVATAARHDRAGEPEPNEPAPSEPGVVLVCGTRGAVPVPPTMPVIDHRVGIDLHPVDVTDDDEARWLRACVWPDQVDRFARLTAAIDIARQDPPTILAGDAAALLPGTIASIPGTAHPVVTNTWVLGYLTTEQRLAYLDQLHRIGGERDLTWIFAESPAENPGLPVAPDLAGRHVTALTMVRWRSGENAVAHLGVAHPHGYWLHWRDGAP